MLKKGMFFDLLDRRGLEFDEFLRTHRRYEHYIDLHGYVLPFDYGSAELEYRAIRNGCALFDASSSRKYWVRGSGAGAFLDYLLTRPVSASPPMRGIYAVFCNDNGTLKDDVILYKSADNDYLLMPAFPHDEYFEEVRARSGIADVRIIDCSDSLVSFSLQGPLSATLLRECGFDGVELLKPFDMKEFRTADGPLRLARMGFTGDLGYECWFEPELCGAIVRRIKAASKALDIEVIGYGLSALETCRLEAGLVVPGRECATEYSPLPGMERSPFELNLGWLVKFDGREFVGRKALQEHHNHDVQYTLLSFEMEGRRPLQRCGQVYTRIADTEVPIGRTTSSTWSWGLERTIGHASVERRHAECRQAHVYVGEERVGVRFSKGPLVSLSRRTEMPAPTVAAATKAPTQ